MSVGVSVVDEGGVELVDVPVAVPVTGVVVVVVFEAVVGCVPPVPEVPPDPDPCVPDEESV